MSGAAWEEDEARVRGGLSVGTEDDLPRCLEGDEFEAWDVLPGSPSLDPIMPRVAPHCLCNTRPTPVSRSTPAHTTRNVPLLTPKHSTQPFGHKALHQNTRRGVWC